MIWQYQYGNIGQTDRRLGKTKQTNGQYQKCRDIDSNLATQDPAALSWKVGLANAWFGIGDLSISEGRLEDGQAALNHSLEILNSLVEKVPENPEFQNEQADTLRLQEKSKCARGSLEA